ncbi:hypothetical protein V865_007951 [Kwoniella europaea PYCC6329]|uniref:Uncharacterized protein n=1 Tax=Kwoniella europaea PYCC6329 TaxID=1423913 RepID=A0AAX4KTZ8_9TREE
MSETEEKFSIRDFSQSYSLPDAVNTLLTEFQTHVQTMMNERMAEYNISDPSSMIEPHTRLPPQVRDTLHLAATEATEAWKSIVDSAALCVRDIQRRSHRTESRWQNNR